MNMNVDMIVVLKNGHRFKVNIKDVSKWYCQMAGGMKPNAINNNVIESPFWINLSEVAAIHPADAKVD